MLPLALLTLLAPGRPAPQDPLAPVVTVRVGQGPSLAQFRKTLAGQRGSLVVLPGGDPAWAARLRDLFSREPLSDMEVPSRTVPAGSPLDRELRAAQGWSAGPHWALLGPDLRILCQGTEVPTRPELLAVELQAAGWQTRLEVVSDFLRRRPDHLEAQWERVQLLQALAARRVKPLLVEGKSDTLRHPLTAE